MHRLRTFFTVLLTTIVVGCVTSGHSPMLIVDNAIVEVLFATDRKKDNVANTDTFYGPERGLLSYGIARVSIPRDHRMGDLESPSLIRLEFNPDPEKHVVLLDIENLDSKSYFETIRNRLDLPDKKNALIFIHGYNVTFENAARRTAQMTYDLGFAGVPVLYSWPSQGSTPKYTVDEVNIKWTERNINLFLTEFLEKSDADNVYLIAHSMGNRALASAYIDVMKKKPIYRDRVKEVILAAPDIDAKTFKRDIAPALVGIGAPVTLYASSEDIPLKASKAVHDGYARAGDSGDDLIVISGIETIDATNVDTSFLGHSYYADERSVISDMFYIIRQFKRDVLEI